MDKEKKQLRRRLLTLGLVVSLIGYGSYEHVYHPKYEILEDDLAFAKYSKGKIYIGDKCFLEGICPNEGDILVLDDRFDDNPDMKIYSSCDIDDKDIRNEILEVLCRYEECFPSPWDRTIESMRLEWFWHNASYRFNHETHRTQDVDLDNNDQDIYDNEILRRILKI